MSKKNRKRSPEIPQVGNALEVPNYVTPMTDLEYRAEIEHSFDAHPELFPAGEFPTDYLMR